MICGIDTETQTKTSSEFCLKQGTSSLPLKKLIEFSRHREAN